MKSTHHEPGVASPESAEHQEIQLLDYWRVLVRRRFILLGCLALVVVVSMTLTLLTPPRYRGSTTLEIKRGSPEVVEFTDVVSVDPSGYMDFQNTQQKLVLRGVVAGGLRERHAVLGHPCLAYPIAIRLDAIVALAVLARRRGTDARQQAA